MEKTHLLRIWRDKEGDVKVDCPNNEEAVLAAAEHIITHLADGDTTPLTILHAVVVHTLASESTGNLERNFLDNLHRSLKEYREIYAKMDKDLTLKN